MPLSQLAPLPRATASRASICGTLQLNVTGQQSFSLSLTEDFISQREMAMQIMVNWFSARRFVLSLEKMDYCDMKLCCYRIDFKQ